MKAELPHQRGVPNRWNRLRVIDLGDVQGGKQRDVSAPGPLRPYLRVANVYDGRIDVSDVLSMPFTDEEFKRYLLAEGDVLLNEGQSLELVGRCSLYRGEFGGPCAFQNALIRFRAGPQATPEFAEQLFRWCQQSGVFASIATQTTSIAHLGTKRFSHLLLDVPPLGEQRKIAAILASVDETIEKTAAVIAQLQVVKKAMMQELLTRGLPGRHTRFKHTELGNIPESWEVKPLGELIAHGPDNGLYRPKTDYGSGTPIVRIDSFGNADDLPASGYQRVRLSDPDVKRYGLQPDDIVINRVNSLSHLGKSAFVAGMLEATVFESNMMRISVEQRVLQPRFAFHWVSGGFTRDYFVARAKQAVAQASVNQRDVRELPVPVPPLDEQAAIAGSIDSTISYIRREEELMAHLRSTKAALMSALLTGQVRVTPDGDTP